MFCQFYGSQGIGGFTRLRNGNYDVIFIDNRLTVAKFGRILHLYGYAGKLFDGVHTNLSRVPRRATGSDNDTFGIHEFFLIINKAGKRDIICIHINAATHTVGQGHGLFKNFLQHEMRITTFFQLAQGHFQFMNFRCFFNIANSHDFHRLIAAQGYDFFIAYINHFIGVFYDWSGI